MADKKMTSLLTKERDPFIRLAGCNEILQSMIKTLYKFNLLRGRSLASKQQRFVGDRLLVGEAVLLLAALQLGLRLLPLRIVCKLIATASASEALCVDQDLQVVFRVARAVHAAHACIPSATCLPQALAAHMLLERNGVRSQLRIGVAKGSGGQLHAHAWVEHWGQIVTGYLPDLDLFVELPALELFRR